MATLTKPKKGTENLCLYCKHNQIKIFVNMSFVTGDKCTGICTNPNNDIYYNSVKFTCEDWEGIESEE
jgi:hypothetical protein